MFACKHTIRNANEHETPGECTREKEEERGKVRVGVRTRVENEEFPVGRETGQLQWMEEI